MPCIESVIPGHLEMFFRDMLDEKGNEIQYGNCFFHIGIILMFIVVESHIIAIVRINAGGGNDRTSKVTADVFYDRVSAAESWFGVDIEAIFIFFVNGSLGLFKRRTDMQFHFIQQGGLESFAEVSIAEVFHNLPEAVIGETAFGKETVDMGIPLEGSAEGMEDADETGHKVSAFVHIMEEPEDDTADSPKKAVKKGSGHPERKTAGGTKFRVAAERDKFKLTAVRTAIHGATVRRIPAVYHFFDVFHDDGTGMKDIFNFFKVFFKNFL